MLQLPLDDVLTEMLSDSDVVTAPILNGIPDGDFAPVERWYRTVQAQSGTLAHLVRPPVRSTNASLRSTDACLRSRCTWIWFTDACV
eukprot:2849384-Pyramimonas_sp.AAC.2